MKTAFLNAHMSLTLTVVLCFFVTALHAQNLVADPAFADGFSGNTFVDWTFSGSAVSSPTGMNFPPGANNAVGLGWSSLLSQNITTVPGQIYNFSFYATAYTGPGGDSPVNMVVSFGNSTLPELTLYSNPNFEQFNYEGTATSTSTLIQFSNPSTTTRFPMFTDVSVIAAPEPGTLVLFIAGLLLWGVQLVPGPECLKSRGARRD